MPSYFFLPLISFASGFASLYIDPRTDKARAWIVISILLASSLFTGIYGYKDGKSHDAEVNRAQDFSRQQLALAQTAVDVEKTSQQKIDQMSEDVATLRTLLPQNEGDKPGASVPASAGAPIVEYFAKSVDGDAITKAAKATGFALVTMRGQRPGSTNAMWVGDDVSPSDIKALALALVGNGVQLRTIQRFRNGLGPKPRLNDRKTGLNDPKARLIEIGRDESMVSAPVWTRERIQSLGTLPPRS